MKLFHSATVTKASMDASKLAQYLSPKSNRYQHILGVVRLMEDLLPSLQIPDNWKPHVIQACYLHDIGYSPKLNQYGFHPLDGAIFASKKGFVKPVVSAILFHSCAYEIAQMEKNQKRLSIYQAHLPLLDEHDRLLIDLVTYCDIHTSPTGEKISFQERVKEVIDRYGAHHPVSKMMVQNQKHYEVVVTRVNQLIRPKIT